MTLCQRASLLIGFVIATILACRGWLLLKAQSTQSSDLAAAQRLIEESQRQNQHLKSFSLIEHTAQATYCRTGTDITTEAGCRIAATLLGLKFDNAFEGPGDHR